jgi:predicted dehydrogenase
LYPTFHWSIEAMSSFTRRDFLNRSTQTGLGLAAGAMILANAQSVRGTPANNKLTLGVIGAGHRGGVVTNGLLQRGDCQVAWVADVNLPQAGWAAAEVAKTQGKAPKAVQDFRKVLDQKDVDAVVVATPDHWHALATIWACQAGKDVYVEKPPTHNCWEGRKMVEAARKYKRIVQVGTQNRSAPYNIAARKYIQDGKLGKIHFCRVYNQKEWPNWPVVPDSVPPKGLDWDMWNGPAPEAKYNLNCQRNWHHLWRYSSGDIVNDAIHQIDLARYLLGVDYPKSVYSTGGRFNDTGSAETPDTQMAVFEFDRLVLSFELTLWTPYMLKISPIIRQSDTEFPYWLQCATRIEIYGSEGLMIVGRHGGGWQVFTRPKLHEGVVKAQNKSHFPDPDHQANFVECVRSRKTPNADIEEGHRSVLLSHLANISYRLGGQKLTFDAKSEKIVGNEDAMKYYRREYRKPYLIEDNV